MRWATRDEQIHWENARGAVENLRMINIRAA
jgi:hypothetical protein